MLNIAYDKEVQFLDRQVFPGRACRPFLGETVCRRSRERKTISTVDAVRHTSRNDERKGDEYYVYWLVIVIIA